MPYSDYLGKRGFCSNNQDIDWDQNQNGREDAFRKLVKIDKKNMALLFFPVPARWGYDLA